MNKIPYTVVDVFAEEKYAGNQLAVFHEASSLSTQTMQQIAREINFSETTFIESICPDTEGYPVRIFTPNHEIPFAGHPTLGTAFVLNDEIIQTPSSRIHLHLKAGAIPVDFPEGPDGVIWMQQNQPVFGTKYKPEDFMAHSSLTEDDIDTSLPIQEVSTGLPCIILPLRSLQAAQQIQWNTQSLNKFLSTQNAKTALIFCRETTDPACQIHARFFADYFGVPEDPATGSAIGNLAGYLAEYMPGPHDFIVEQGLEMGRPSRLYMKAGKENNQYTIQIGGKVQKIASGFFV
jgi:trans-2,3-dihydro-3-hydroxyanthranilate isomerase